VTLNLPLSVTCSHELVTKQLIVKSAINLTCDNTDEINYCGIKHSKDGSMVQSALDFVDIYFT